MSTIVSVKNLTKTYNNGFQALKSVNLDIEESEIIALLGPNGAGKTTLISIICGIVNPTSGQVLVGGHDIVRDYRQTRGLIGLVPQELHTESFESVWATVNYSRGLFGLKPNHDYVDVELRKDMWRVVEKLRKSGVTIILTTHYIEEAEAIADRIGIINGGEIKLVEDKQELMRKLGKKQMMLELKDPMTRIPDALLQYDLTLSDDGKQLHYLYDASKSHTGIAALLQILSELEIKFKDLVTKQSSLEDIFVDLIQEEK
ncbi:MAG: ABC transporter ATP-binding protein [Reinekea sp.]